MSGAPPYPLATLAPTIDATGISAPTFEDILASYQASYKQIYGSDLDLDPDTQDGQWLSVQTKIVYDMNQALINGYLSYSPSFAQGVGLSSIVKINGLQRETPSNSTAAVILVGQAGVQINNGVVGDILGNLWSLPSPIVIPFAGQITVTATAQQVGAISAAANTITTMVTGVRGWQSVTNPDPATPGLPVETDAQLRKRQSVSTSLPAITPLESIQAAVANLSGVGRIKTYDNDTDYIDMATGIPPHSIALVVEGGDANAIATTMVYKKNTGCGTYGDIEIVVQDPAGVPQTVNFFYLSGAPINVAIGIQVLPGFVDTTSNLIVNAIAAFIHNLDIGETVYQAWLYGPANLQGQEAMLTSGLTQAQLDLLSATYVVRHIIVSSNVDPDADRDIEVPFNYAATCNPSNIALSLVTSGT